jgi:hypothetical protein
MKIRVGTWMSRKVQPKRFKPFEAGVMAEVEHEVPDDEPVIKAVTTGLRELENVLSDQLEAQILRQVARFYGPDGVVNLNKED